MAKKKRKWQKTQVPLPENHAWEAAPGNKVFVADAGAMQFEVPENWTIKQGEKGSIRFFDRKKEKDADMRLEVSLIYAPPNIDWSGLPLTKLIEDAALADDSRGLTGRSPFNHFFRGNLEGAWLEVDFIDADENRPAHSRICMARGPAAYALITMDFWVDDAHRANPVWDAAIGSLKLDGTNRNRLNIDGTHRTRLSMN